MPFLTATAVEKSYEVGTSRLPVLKGLDVTLEKGEMVAVVGASGVGKSTLLHLIGGLDALDGGSVRIGDASIDQMDDEARVRFRNRHVGFVFQFHHLLPEFTAVENVAMPLLIAGQPAREAKARAEALLGRVGLDLRLEHRPGALSGGEQQRVAVARALVCQPSVLLADEPTGNLDGDTGQHVMDLLFSLREKLGTTLVLITHDRNLAARCGRVVRMADGKIAGDAPAPLRVSEAAQ